jgi:hypothetical protein
VRFNPRPVKITKIERRSYNRPVYNLAVQDDESFYADGVAVHNCRSILIPVTQIDDWDGKEDKIPAGVQPMKGFA